MKKYISRVVGSTKKQAFNASSTSWKPSDFANRQLDLEFEKVTSFAAFEHRSGILSFIARLRLSSSTPSVDNRSADSHELSQPDVDDVESQAELGERLLRSLHC